MIKMKALVLIRITGKEPIKILDQIKTIQGVKYAFLTFGRFDCVALIEATDLAGIKACVKSIQSIVGVRRTETLIGV